MLADTATLKPLLDPRWLEKNDFAVLLLSEWFGFDELELRLLGTEPNSAKRQELRNSLAKLVELGGADPALYVALADEVEARRRRSRDVGRFRRLGIAVQEAVKRSMESRGLVLTLIDRGFDYEVALPSDDTLEEVSMKFEIGSYLLEVKATTTGKARLTPTQAATASIESPRYLLCVVDLRNLSEDQLEAEWTPERVEPLSNIVSQIGDKVQITHRLVEQARTSSVGIRNESALRYEVPLSVWNSGVSISDWVKTLLTP
jgi:hypothetical protein